MYRFRPRPLLSLISIAVSAALLAGGAAWHAAPPVARAQIDNAQPTQPFASAVGCIQAGQDRGLASHDSPRFASACFASAWDIAAYEQAGNPAAGDAPASDAAIYGFGDGQPDASGEPGHTTLASVGTGGSLGGGVGLGAIYGLAYASGTNPASSHAGSARIYGGAFTKRMTRFGSGGPGAIYMLDLVTQQEIVYAQIPATLPGPSGAGLPGDGTTSNYPNGSNGSSYSASLGGIHTIQGDTSSIQYVGKTSLGDLDLDPQERYLYGVNAWSRRIFRIDTWSANPQASLTDLGQHPFFSVPSTCNVSGRSGPQDLWVSGLGVTADSIYVGFVCTAETSQDRRDLAGGVMRYSLSSGAWDPGLAVGFALADYDAQRLWSGSGVARWRPWTSDPSGDTTPLGGPFRTAPQAILADIAFDEGGNMLIGMRDRFGDIGMSPRGGGVQPLAQGDLLIAAPSGPYQWSAPSSGSEQFDDRAMFPGGGEPETMLGALATLPGTHAGGLGGEVVSTAMNPYGSNSGGLAWFNTSGGERSAAEELYNNASLTRFAKASGMGDVEVLCAWRAVGDRIWRDTNGNGVQEAGDPDISNVLLNLRDANGALVTRATTGALSGMGGNFRFYVNPFQAYTIEIDASNYAAGGPLAGLGVTTAHVGSDALDSDADQQGRIVVAPGGRGDLTMTLDAGLTTGANVRITKTGPASAALGNVFAYTLSYQNDGPASAANVVVADTLPGGLTLFSANPPPTTASGQTLSWSLGTLSAGAAGTITVNVVVQASAPASVTNSALISTGTSGDLPGDNTSSATTAITRPNVRIAKSGPGTAAAGSIVTYSLLAENTGSASAASVRVNDTLPPGLTFVSASPAPTTTSGQSQSWTIAALGAGGATTISVQAQIATTASSMVVNSATISTISPGDDALDNISSALTTVVRPNVMLSKAGPAAITAGEMLTYTLTYRNTGTSPAESSQVVDHLPAGLSLVSASPAPSAQSGSDLTWDVGTLSAGASGTIVLRAQSGAGLPNGATVINTATVSTSSVGDDPNDNSASRTTAVQRADLYVTKSSVTSFPVASGQPVTYLIDYGNSGPASAREAVIADIAPAQLSGVSWACEAGCSQSGVGALTLALGTLAPGATGRIRVMGTATTSSAREEFTNTATAVTSTPEITGANNSSSVPGAVWTTDLQVIKLATPQVAAGDTFTTTLSYRNNGPAPADSAVLTDTLPSGITLVSATPAPSATAGAALTWELGTLADAISGTVTLVLRADPGLADGVRVSNQSAIRSSTADRSASNNQADAETLVVARADLQITKTGPGSVNIGDQAAFTISYSNAGPSVARGVVITDTLPVELDLLTASPAPGQTAGRVLTWNLGDLPPGASGSISVQMQTRAPQLVNALPATNQAMIGSHTADDHAANSADDHTLQILRPDVMVSKAGPAIANDGQTIVYTLVYENRGAALATDVAVVDTLPAGLTLISASPAPTAQVGQRLTWDVGSLAAGASGSVTLLARVEASAAATLINAAQVQTTAPGDDPANNASSVVTVVQRADVSVAKNGPARATVGDTLTYTLQYRVAGTSLAHATALTDTLPSGLTFLSAMPPPSQISGQRLVWGLGSLSPASSGTISVLARVEPSAAASLINSASIGTASAGDDPANNTSAITTAIDRPNVVVEKHAPATVRAGATFSYTLSYRNSGTAAASAVVLTDPLPAGVVFVEAAPAPTTRQGATLQWDLGTLAPSESGVIVLTVRADAVPPGGGASGDLVNRAEIHSGAPGDSLGDNIASATARIQRPDLSVAKTNRIEVAQPGDVLTYTLTITNSGPVDASGVVLSERPPAGSSLRTPGWLREPDGSYSLPIGAIAAGGVLTRTVVIQLPNPLAGSSVSNTVQVEDDIFGDPTPQDAVASDRDILQSAALGDQIWGDVDGDRLQGPGEEGLANVHVQLLDATTLELVAGVVSDGSGHYRFDGLRPGRYVVQVDPQTTLAGPLAGYRLTTEAFYERSLTAAQREDMTSDFGLRPAPTTAVTLAAFSAAPFGEGLQVAWQTTREIGTERFILLRGASPHQADARVIASILSQGTTGGRYTFVDREIPTEGAYYWLIEVERDGAQNLLVAWPQRSSALLPYAVYLPSLVIARPATAPARSIGATR